MKDFWNERYAASEYAYGVQPNAFFKEQLEQLPSQGKALFPAEGEGRNAVYAAQKGWDVTAFDISDEGQKKALALASEKNVTIHYNVVAPGLPDLPKDAYDLIVLIYAHFDPTLRVQLHEALLNSLRPGGTIILEAFHKENLPFVEKNPQVGGPRNEALLMDENTLRTEFKGLNISLLEKQIVHLNEGLYHVGEGCVVRMVGRRYEI